MLLSILSFLSYRKRSISDLLQYLRFVYRFRDGTRAMVKQLIDNLKSHHTLQISRITVLNVTYSYDCSAYLTLNYSSLLSEKDLNDVFGLIEDASRNLLHKNEHYRGVDKVFRELVVPPFLEVVSRHKKNVKLDIALVLNASKISFIATPVVKSRVAKSDFR
jgi:hypothetical protein